MKKTHGGARKSSDHFDHLKTSEIVAKDHGVSAPTIRRDGQYARAVERLSAATGKSDHELVGMFDSKKDLVALLQVSEKKDTETALEVLDIFQEAISGSGNGTKITDSKVTIRTAIREHTRRQQSEQAKAIEIKNELIDFRLGDFIDVLSDIPDGSIDLIITDPPYPYEYIGEWSKLSAFAARVLKEGGFCVAYSGGMHLPSVMQRLGEKLDYYWTFCLMQSGYSQFLTPRNLYVNWKSILLYQNGFSLYKPEKYPIVDVIDGSGKAKFSHVWRQGEDELDGLIEYFTNVGDKICDPFAGSGTTLIKSAKMKRYAIGCEIDETHYNNAKKRITDGI